MMVFSLLLTLERKISTSRRLSAAIAARHATFLDAI
jgi:hypothetical protein